MSENKPAIPKDLDLTEEQLAKIGGGDCTPEEWMKIVDSLQNSYESLVSFTSYVIERVVTASK